MTCYVCDRAGRATAAVAVCRSCYVALCREHLDQELRTPGPGGMRYGCSHNPAGSARSAAPAPG